MVHTSDIAVVGAGVAGLSCAIMLARSGRRVTLYERFQEPNAIGSGLMIQPTGLAALDRMGLRASLESRGHWIGGLHGVNVQGRTIFNLRYGDLSPALYAVAVHRAALHQVLWGGFRRTGATLVTGCTVTAVEARHDGCAIPIDDRGQRHPAAELLIDASGTHSPIRARVTARAARPFPYGAVWASVPDPGIAPGMLAQRYDDARVMIGLLPIGSIAPAGPPLAAFFWSLKPAEYDDWRRNFPQWRERVATLWPALAPVLDHLPGPDALTLASYRHFTADRLWNGPQVLVGDAAHATSPQLGQGANQAMIDAVVLADALDAADSLAAALDRYAAARRRHVRFYQTASALMTPFFQSDSRLLARLRDLTFDRFRLIPYLRREMVRTLAGLKTGLLTSAAPDAIVNGAAPPGEA